MVEGGAIEPGMEVVTKDSQVIGRVKDVGRGGRYFRVDCPRAPDLYISVEAVTEVQKGLVRLQATKLQAENMGWELRPGDYRR